MKPTNKLSAAHFWFLTVFSTAIIVTVLFLLIQFFYGLNSQDKVSQASSGPPWGDDANLLSADFTSHAYRSSASGEEDCAMPEDYQNPAPGDCDVSMSQIKIGTWTYREGDTCIRHTLQLVRMETIRMEGGKEVELPHTRESRDEVQCPV